MVLALSMNMVLHNMMHLSTQETTSHEHRAGPRFPLLNQQKVDLLVKEKNNKTF